MTPPPEYEPRWYEGLFAGVTRRVDYTNALLVRLIELQGGVPPETPSWLQQLLDALNRLSDAISSFSPTIPPNREFFLTGQRTVDTAGTAVQLTTSSITVPGGFQLTVIAKPGNSGTIYFGNSKGDAEGAMKFDGLSAGLAHSFRVKNVNLVWVNGDTDGDGVSWIVEQ